MKLNSIRDFLAVAEHGSMRSAAKVLDLTQPALTRSIRELEKSLGATLFERNARGVVLTAMGQAFLVRSRAVRSELQRAQNEIDQLRGHLRGSIRVCLSSVAHMTLLPDALRMFRQRYPDVRLHLFDGLLPTVVKQIQDGTIDCYVGPIFDGVGHGLAVEKLFDTRRVVVCRKGHPLAKARSLRELVDAEWVGTPIMVHAEQGLVPLFASHGLPPPKFVVHAQAAQTFLFTVAYSDLLMLLPVEWTQVPMFRDSLDRIDVRESLPVPALGLVQRSGLPLTPAAEYFCDMVRRVAAHVRHD